MSRPWLITGGDGFIGRHVRAVLRERGDEVVWVAEPGRGEERSTLARSETLRVADLRSRDAVDALVVDLRPIAVLNLAAVGVAPATAATLCDFVDLNVRLPAHLSQIMPEDCTLVHVGSMSQYAGDEQPLGESSAALSSVTPYGWSKNAADSLLAALDAGSARPRSIRVRLFGVIGGGEPDHRLIPSIVRALRRGEPALLSDGAQVRDVLHVDDVARGLVHLAAVAALRGRAVNLGRGEGRTVRWLAERAATRLGATHLLAFGATPRRPGEPDTLVADVSLIRSTGWAPQLSFDESVDRAVDEVAASVSG